MLSDEQVGRNLAALRGTVSQKDLAAAMRELGFKWSQATVWSIEKGERPLRLVEAQALGVALGKSNAWLLVSSNAASDAMSAGMRAAKLHDALLELIEQYQEARMGLAFALDEVKDEDLTNGLVGLGKSWLNVNPEDVVAAYRREAGDASEAEVAALEARFERRSELTFDSWFNRFNAINYGERQAEA
ncbi:hypothetical protein [Microbacterium sp. PAMC21962]|uniref:hypothetical protein n=1 Tax=Microbacterium sp. PAMC21962 TaxID=2861280 RepID=UPI001C62CCFE|nr:hypothetical protein [Microbacterium sp. PAMC21962]QYF98103.1 hypothetical protein KY498_02280 [Microbacterium sp. PAMC21962]